MQSSQPPITCQSFLHLHGFKVQGMHTQVPRIPLEGADIGIFSRWGVGVLIYEMLAGYPPFYDEDRVVMFKNICHVKYTFPQNFSKVCFCQTFPLPTSQQATPTVNITPVPGPCWQVVLLKLLPFCVGAFRLMLLPIGITDLVNGMCRYARDCAPRYFICKMPVLWKQFKCTCHYAAMPGRKQGTMIGRLI